MATSAARRFSWGLLAFLLTAPTALPSFAASFPPRAEIRLADTDDCAVVTVAARAAARLFEDDPRRNAKALADVAVPPALWGDPWTQPPKDPALSWPETDAKPLRLDVCRAAAEAAALRLRPARLSSFNWRPGCSPSDGAWVSPPAYSRDRSRAAVLVTSSSCGMEGVLVRLRRDGGAWRVESTELFWRLEVVV